MRRATPASTRRAAHCRACPLRTAGCRARLAPARPWRTRRSRARRRDVSWQNLRYAARLPVAQRARRDQAALAVPRFNPPRAACLGVAFEDHITVAIGGDEA